MKDYAAPLCLVPFKASPLQVTGLVIKITLAWLCSYFFHHRNHSKSWSLPYSFFVDALDVQRLKMVAHPTAAREAIEIARRGRDGSEGLLLMDMIVHT